MPAEPLHLSVTEAFSDAHCTRTMHLDGKAIFFRTIAEVLPPPLSTWDFAVVASIFTAMRLGRPLHVAGPVSSSLLRNLEDFQEVWSTWLPKNYHRIEIVAAEEVEGAQPLNRKGVFAFSGGVDATFSLLRHVRKKAGRRTLVPAVAVLIKGFDIPMVDVEALRTAEANARIMLRSLDVPLAVIETNWKADLCFNWTAEHAAGLAACLFQFGGIADAAVIGSDLAYDDLAIEIGWGSNQVTNRFLSSDSLAVYTEGGGFTRSERLAFIIENSDLAPYLRVCWENAQTGKNCGTCEKCIRTQLNLRAVGADPQGFLQIAGLFRIATIPSKTSYDNHYILEIQRTAARRHIWGAWRLAAYVAMVKNFALLPMTLSKEKLKLFILRNEHLHRHVKWVMRRYA